MKYIGKTILALLVLVIFYSGFSVFHLRKELFTVHDVLDKYAMTNEQADLTIVDFNKYSCSLCQTIHPILMEAIKKDGKVRYIPRFVTHGFIWNETLASAVYAAAEQDKFIEMHNIIYKKWPIEDHDTLYKYAKAIGIDTKKLSRDMVKPEIIDMVRQDQNYFDAWKLQQTPALLIGKKIIYRPSQKMPTVEELLEKFAQARL